MTNSERVKAWRKQKPELWRNIHKRQVQRRCEQLNEIIFQRLGDICVKCSKPGTRKKPLEVHHVDGKSWDHKKLCHLSRLKRYVDELNAGVKLEHVCQKCHSKISNGGKNGN